MYNAYVFTKQKYFSMLFRCLIPIVQTSNEDIMKLLDMKCFANCTSITDFAANIFLRDT
jgi:hypothetical protein